MQGGQFHPAPLFARIAFGLLTMKLLLSAYACEPNTGSEHGIGWHWAAEVTRLGARGVGPLTRADNRHTIKAELSKLPPMPNLQFTRHDLPRWARWWKKGRRGIHLSHLLWQEGCVPPCKNGPQARAVRPGSPCHFRERPDLVSYQARVPYWPRDFASLLALPTKIEWRWPGPLKFIM